MHAYVDHNFLINCANNGTLRARAADVSRLGKVSFVMSPWHFYEIGKTGPERIQELLGIVTDLQPSWILERFDLQLAEFRQAWGQFWGDPYLPFAPIGSLPDASAALLRSTPERLASATLSHFVDVFSRLGAENIEPVLASQKDVAAANQISYREGRFTPRVNLDIEQSYVAQELASLRMKFTSHDEHARQLLAVANDSLCLEKIRFFVEFGGMRDLRAWRVESILTSIHQAGKAQLNANRQIDRQHAIAGLSYCDRIITDDKELLKLCAEVAQLAPFKVAGAQSAAALFASL